MAIRSKRAWRAAHSIKASVIYSQTYEPLRHFIARP